MRLTQLAALVLAAFLTVQLPQMAEAKTAKPVHSQTKIVKKRENPPKQAVKKASKKTKQKSRAVEHHQTKAIAKIMHNTHKKKHEKNETQKRYGVKGALLKPTKVSNKKHSYREKGNSYTTIGKAASHQFEQKGVASFYAGEFNGRRTASGEIYDENKYTAAHKRLALGSFALVTNLRNGRQVIVRINDRGPFSHKRIIDLSKSAARELGMIGAGTAEVKIEALQVDSQGFVSGKGTQSLLKQAKRHGLSVKIKGEGEQIAIKATESQVVQFGLKVPNIRSLNEAKKMAALYAKTSRIEKRGKYFDVMISLASSAEVKKAKQQFARLGYSVFSYSEQ